MNIAHIVLGLIVAGVVLGLGGCASSTQDSGWAPAGAHIKTRWAKEVRPGAPLPEYPRPQMVRERWVNLNGMWDYSIVGTEKAGKILVPYPLESALSGVAGTLEPTQTLRYRRAFTVPPGWKGDRVLLHFGAVNWHSEVSVDGKKVAEHDGGYDPFTVDITDAVAAGGAKGEHTLVVDAVNPVNSGGQPRGKQWTKPHAIWYTPSSGIWQTVWMEPVARKSIAGMKVNAERLTGNVTVEVTDSVQEADNFLVYEAEVKRDGKRVAIGRSPDTSISVKVPEPRAWTPEEPTLYDLTVRTYSANKVVDEVKSYFAFRDVGLGKDERGFTRLLLNGKPVFQYGPLDQGFWPDGLYTAPTDEALRSDIEAAKRMGCNMIRKHVKVEPERWYYWCDKLGVMVWQDMPSAFFKAKGFDEGFPEISGAWKANFERELKAMIDGLRNHPCIVMWVPWNEGWGQQDMAWSRSVAESCKGMDPTRLVNNATGWTDMGVGDTRDIHAYPEPAIAPIERDDTGKLWGGRAAVLGEFGGLGLPLEGHTWVNNKDNWGYRTYKSADEVTTAYCGLMDQIPALVAQGLCAAVYTQTTDVEVECNGWMTYDREVWKVDPARAKPATAQVYGPAPVLRTVLSRAGEKGGGRMWRYTTTRPGADWASAGGALAGWKEGAGGFGSRGTPGAVIGTEWTSDDIWIRSEFTLDEVPARPHLSVHHDEDAEVYINGSLAMTLKDYTSAYQLVRLSPTAAALLQRGTNTIAIHCHQTRGGQYIDCGIVDVAPGK
jgi:hypothetical protein